MKEFVLSWFRRHPVSPDDLSAYLDGALAARRREQVSRHLAACPNCTADLQALTAVKGAMARLEPVIAPRSFAIPASTLPRPASPPRRFVFAPALALTALLLLLAGDFLVFPEASTSSSASQAPAAAKSSVSEAQNNAAGAAARALDNADKAPTAVSQAPTPFAARAAPVSPVPQDSAPAPTPQPAGAVPQASGLPSTPQTFNAQLPPAPALAPAAQAPGVPGAAASSPVPPPAVVQASPGEGPTAAPGAAIQGQTLSSPAPPTAAPALEQPAPATASGGRPLLRLLEVLSGGAFALSLAFYLWKSRLAGRQSL